MPAILPGKRFEIPFSGGMAIVIAIADYTTNNTQRTIAIVNKIDANGIPIELASGDTALVLNISVNAGVMTVSLSAMRGYTINDVRCCVIPGDPFA